MIGVVLSGQHGMGIVERLIVVPCIGIVQAKHGIAKCSTGSLTRSMALCRQSSPLSRSVLFIKNQ